MGEQTMSTHRLILTRVEGPIATLTLNRPEKLNAVNYATADALAAALDTMEARTDVRAIILTGAGERAFCAGADIPEFARSVSEGRATAVQQFVRRGQRLTDQIEALTTPVIAAINGLAYGGGCEITEAAPLAIATDDAMFAKPEVLLGMPPTFGGTQRLARQAGRKQALQWLLTGAPFDAVRARDMGLVNEVVPRAELAERARSLAEAIAQQPPETVAAILTATTRGLNVSIEEGLRLEREAFARLVGTRTLSQGLERWTTRDGRSAPASGDPS
jgi:enoyl-CoA hydratase/carnithine racemase